MLIIVNIFWYVKLHDMSIFLWMQYILPAIIHINHQPYLERGDGPIVSYYY